MELTKIQWGKKRRRIYGRILSGITKLRKNRSSYFDKRVRFLTLTSSKDSLYYRMGKDWSNFVARVRRSYVDEAKTRRRVFEFIKVQTSEGYGVIHCLYWGDYIPQKIVSSMWNAVHKAYIVDIRNTWGTAKDIAKYLVQEYLLEHSYLRMSCSKDWIFKGFNKIYKNLFRKNNYRKAIKKWNRILKYGVFEQKNYKYTSLLDYG